MDTTGRVSAPVRIPAFVFEGIEAIRDSGKTSMSNSLAVRDLAKLMGYPATAQWIEWHPTLYAAGVLYGFEPNE